MLEGKEVDLETTLREMRRLLRRSATLYIVAGCFAFAFLFLGFSPTVTGKPWVDALITRVDFGLVFGLLGVANTFAILWAYTRYSMVWKDRTIIFSRTEKLAYGLILSAILWMTVILLLWYKWGPSFI